MALLSQYVGGYTPGDPYKQPAFAIWGSNGSQGGYSVLDHNLNCIARFMYNNSDIGKGAVMSSTGAPELFDSNSTSQYAMTNAEPSSSTTSDIPAWNGYLGHLCHSMGFTQGSNGTGDLMGSGAYATYRGQGHRDVGVIVNDIYQDYAFFKNTTSLRIGPRSLTWYAHISYNQSTDYLTLAYKNAGYSGTTYGSMSYNATTNKLVVMESNGSYTWKPTIYSNVPKLRYYAGKMWRDDTDSYSAGTASTGILYTFFANAANYSTSYAAATGKPRNNDTEDNQRCIPVMCDDGSVVMYQMIPSGNPNAWISRWNSAGTHSGSLKTWAGTTSYGLAQGDQFGARFVISSDGKFVLAYSCYYYYGAGTHVALIRVSDGKFVWDTQDESTSGYFYTPIGKSDFFCMKTTNGDSGSGVYHQTIASHELMNNAADNTQVNMCRGFLTQTISSNFYSTDYPILISLQYDTALFSAGTQ